MVCPSFLRIKLLTKRSKSGIIYIVKKGEKRLKCKFCDKEVEKKDAFIKIINGKRFNFCNDLCYDLFVKQDIARFIPKTKKKEEPEDTSLHNDELEIYDLMNDIVMNGRKDASLPTKIFHTKYLELTKLYKPEKLKLYLKNNGYKICEIVNTKTFDSYYQELNYISAIIKNRIDDYKQELEGSKPVEQKVNQDDFFTVKQRPNTFTRRPQPSIWFDEEEEEET